MYSFTEHANPVLATRSLLSHLNVRVSKKHIVETLHDHPDYPSILSISDALKQWKVDNYVLHADKEKLHQLPLPFIAHLQNTDAPFITITNVTPDYVVYRNVFGGNKKLNKPIQVFLSEWSGVSLLAEATENSGEKNYRQSRKKEILQLVKLPFVISLVIAFAAYLTIFQYYHTSIFFAVSLLLLLKLAGCGVAALLLWYEVDNANPVLKQICGLGKQTNCSAVLNSKQSKLLNTVSWSEIGFVYFAGGFISLLVAGAQAVNVLQILAWMNVLALPYTVFSVYYQWKVAKQWCVLCLAVQILIIAEFITAVTANPYSLSSVNPHLSISSSSLIILILSSVIFPAVAWFFLKPVLLQNQEAKHKKRELMRFKYDGQIFDALLAKQKQLTANPTGLGITIGNPDATNTIVKVCNPYCGPCAKAHLEIDKLIEDNNDLKVQILFTAANDEKDKRSLPVKHLLAIAEKRNEVLTKKALDDWYLADKKEYQAFAAKYPMNGELKKQGLKVEAMDKWCKETGVTFTPTFFINGYQLPSIYTVKDLKFFLE